MPAVVTVRMEDPGLKLEKETNSLNLLGEKMEKCNTLSKDMCSILTSFDEHLMKLEQTILPVYLETGNLQRRQENIDKILDRLDYVIQYYNVPKEVESKIRDGPSGCLQSYLECLKKIQSSIDFFQKNNQDCQELVELSTLFDDGAESLQSEFRNLLYRYSKPIPAITILDMLGMDDEMPTDEEKLSVEQLPAIRSNVLTRSIQKFVRKATAVIAKYSPTVESAMLGHRFQSSLLPETKDEVIENDVMSFMTSVSGLLKLMQSELNLMLGVIPNKNKKVVFERVVTQAMENLVSEGELIVSKVKKSVSRHEFSAALNLFPILRHLMAIKADFEKLFQGCSSTLYDKLRGFVITVQATISKTLEEFIESIKNDPDTKMPKDGTVHQLTSNAIMLLEQLQDYQDILSSVLALQDSSFAASKDKGKLAFAQYITRVLSALTTTLNNKSNYYSDGFLCAIFRLNNLHYILKALQRTGLIEIVKLHASDVEKNLNLQIRDQKRVYSQSWSRVLHYVMEVDKPISQQRAVSNTSQLPASMKLRDKDKQNIKDKFAGFNKEMEEITRTQKAYAVPDVELRESLKRDNKEFIIPKYTMFYEKYIDAGFTKNTDKYIKYTPQDISNTIDTFFDAAA
ncbi:UNVERIFIED_CONTAM: Exoc7 [Trichonephila clavipes]